MLRTLLLVLVGAILLVDGYIYGRWSGRWQTSESVETMVTRLERVPLTVGNWRGKSAPALSDREVKQAEFAGYIQRRYENPDGDVVNIFLACGRPGPLSVHTPEVCYRGAGYRFTGQIGKYTQPLPHTDAPAEMWKAKLGKPEAPVPVEMQLCWSWSVNGRWQAPENPRVHFAGAPVLCKLYVTQELRGGVKNADEVCQKFLQEFLPQLDAALYPEP